MTFNREKDTQEAATFSRENIVEIRGIDKGFGKKEVLSELSLNIKRGKIIGLLGPNASGKTTLIKMINGLMVPDRGEIRINGLKPSWKTKSMISYLSDKYYIPEWMKVKEVIGYFNDFFEDFDEERAYKMLYELKIASTDKIKNMSKGTKDKIQLIIAMSRRTELYILDEPIGGVDPAARSYVIRTILNNYPEGATLLIVTHLISEIENICDEVCFLSEGRIVLHMNTDDIREQKHQSVDSLFREVFKC